MKTSQRIVPTNPTNISKLTSKLKFAHCQKKGYESASTTPHTCAHIKPKVQPQQSKSKNLNQKNMHNLDDVPSKIIQVTNSEFVIFL